MYGMLNDPVTALVLFILCAVIALGSLLSAMKSGGSAMGLVLAILFALAAAFFAPTAFTLMSGSPN